MIYDFLHTVDAPTARDVTLPRIVQAADAESTARFNADVARRMKEYDCDRGTGGKPRKGHHFRAESEVTLATDAFISYRIKFDYYCGGPFRSKFESGVTWDLTKGEPVRFFEAFKSPDDRRALLKAAIAGAAPKGCDAARLVQKNDPLEFVVTDAGIELWPDQARVPGACKIRLKMDYEAAQPHLSAASPLRMLRK